MTKPKVAPSMLDSLDLRQHFDKLAAEQADMQSDAEPPHTTFPGFGAEQATPPYLRNRPVYSGLAQGAILDNLTRGDNVTLPAHYKQFKLEPIYFIGENALDWFQGNIVKYACRHKLKNGVEDLQKVIRYTQMYIKFLNGDPDWAK